jgi:hypothetical protein
MKLAAAIAPSLQADMQSELRDIERAVASGTRHAGRGLKTELRRQIVRAFDEGALIRSRRGRFLAIPTENAPRKGTDGKRIRPSTFPEHRFGPLRFVPRSIGPSLLVVEGLRASFSRKTGALRGFRRATNRARQGGQGVTTVVMFLLVPQVKLPKRLDVTRAAKRWSAQLPALIEQQLRSE